MRQKQLTQKERYHIWASLKRWGHTFSHLLKGSATNLGRGGVADILVAFNTYTRTGEDGDIIAAHIQNLKNYLKELKVQFS